MHEIRTVIVELDYPIDSDDPYLNTSVSDEYYGEGRELVYCKDCKHFLKARNENEYDSCAILFEMQDVPLETDEDKYCAWAERKTE